MRIAVISSSSLIITNNKLFAYSPYGKELEIWAKHSDDIYFCCPVSDKDEGLLLSELPFESLKIFKVKSFDIKSAKGIIKAIQYSVFNFKQIYSAMKTADHIHLRCPGNIGLMGCIIQTLFPSKIKTAKYAGNWDLKAKQPLSYRIQKWILNNTFLTKNMTVLVYGEWKNSSKNIKPFFTASYHEYDKIEVADKNLNSTINFVFVGSLTSGKNPFYAIQLIKKLKEKNFNVTLSIYGDGAEFEKLNEYIQKNQLLSFVNLLGNRNQEEIKIAYQNSHFVILPSKSEGWPKVIAEGMFWKCLPIATKVSCIPNMLDNGNRGVLLTLNLETDTNEIEAIVLNEDLYQEKIQKALHWSRKYTLDYFEEEIKKLVGS